MNADIKTPEQVLEMGIGTYNEECRAIVMRYSKEWEATVTRLGRWIDFENDYKTLNLSFMESVWWVFGQLWEKGLVYRGFKVCLSTLVFLSGTYRCVFLIQSLRCQKRPRLQGVHFRLGSSLQRRDLITKHQFALHLTRDSNVVPNYLPQSEKPQGVHFRLGSLPLLRCLHVHLVLPKAGVCAMP